MLRRRACAPAAGAGLEGLACSSKTTRSGSWIPTGSAPPGAFWRNDARSGVPPGARQNGAGSRLLHFHWSRGLTGKVGPRTTASARAPSQPTRAIIQRNEERKREAAAASGRWPLAAGRLGGGTRKREAAARRSWRAAREA
jgi:hypothetical protein